ncbi:MULTISPECIES: hypothetical protein [Ruminococcus]|uniref:hypothetical protein n=1 Tax=Ruminococcus TaxID=1263 RepID=UPI003966F513
MKFKLRRFTAVLSAILCMICCVFSAVPAFADDVSGGGSSSNVIRVKRFSQMIDYAKNNNIDIENSHYIMTYSEDSSQYYWWYYIFFIPDDILVNDTLILTHGRYSSSFTNSFIKARVSDYGNSDIDDLEYCANVDVSSFSLFVDDDEQSHSYPNHIFKSNIKITNNGDDITPSDPSAPPVPFTVDYSPALSEGMSRKGTLVAPGASNDGQEIESNGLNVRVTLTDEFIKLRDSYDELKDYTYEFVCYITTSPPEKSSYEESVKNAVYTSLDYGKYMYTTSGVVDDVTDDNKEPTEWIKAEGINAGYIIGKGGSVKNVTINLENLDSSQFTADTKLYIVVYGRLTSLSVPTPDYFDLDNQGYLCNQGSLNTKQIVTVNADPETGEGTDVVMPDYYCVTSTAFNYKDYPEYKPKIFKNGAEMDTNKPFTDYLDKKLTPDYMYDYDMDKNGESGLAPDDFEKYEEQKNLDKNFGSVDFGLDSIKSVFDGSSDFFKFLTASIGILPTTFLTILISFFVVMLAICVVKWVLK